MEKTIYISGFIKIGQEEHILDLQKKGKIFCNTIEKYRKIEIADKNRHDSREGAFKTEFLDPAKLSLSIKGKDMPVKFDYYRLNTFDNNRNQHKLFCLYGIKNEHATHEPFIDPENINFGNKALIILDSKEFVDRIENKLRSMNLEFSYDFVTYYEEKEANNQLTVYHKPDIFSYQSEFRFYIKHDKPSPLVIEIGSIEKISHLIDSKELLELRLKPNFE